MTHNILNKLVVVLLLPAAGLSMTAEVSALQNPIITVPAPAVFPERLKAPTLPSGAVAGNVFQTVHWAGGERGVTVNRMEKDPLLPTLDSAVYTEFTINTAYRVSSVTTREGGHEIYVAGMRDDGRGLITKYVFQPRANGLQIQIDPAALPDHDVTVVLNGSSWTPPTVQSYGVPSREVILGDEVGIPRSIAVDPNGRYLLILSNDTSNIYQMDLTASPKTLTLIAEPSTIADLPQMANMELLSKRSGGFVALLHEWHLKGGPFSSTWNQVILHDATNDAVFESIFPVADGQAGLMEIGFGYHDLKAHWFADDLPWGG